MPLGQQTDQTASQAWKGQWCWTRKHLSRPWNSYAYFRRTIELPARPRSAVIRISADARYTIFANGKRAKPFSVDVSDIESDKFRRLVRSAVMAKLTAVRKEADATADLAPSSGSADSITNMDGTTAAVWTRISAASASHDCGSNQRWSTDTGGSGAW